MQRRYIYFVYHAKNNVEQKPPTYPEHPSSYRLLVKHVLLTIRNTPSSYRLLVKHVLFTIRNTPVHTSY